MSNQRISSLKPLPAANVQPQDLFLIVDRDSYDSSTGESKNITAIDLSTYVGSQITSGNTAEQSIFQATHSFAPGQVVRMDADSQLYVLASSNSTTGKESEVAGIVRFVTDVDNFILVFAGVVDFKPTIVATNPPSFAPDGLEVGVTYFLGDNGYLVDSDPSEGEHPSWISKPYLLGISEQQGVITNYRGFYRPNSDESSAISLYITGSNSFLIGDAVRKTVTSETASLGQWTLASADSYDAAEVIGVVTQASSNYFSMNLTGRISGLTNLQMGETYYLVPSANILTTGSYQSRNLLPYDSTSCTQFSKPVYVAISSTDAIILNQRTLPDKNSSENRCASAQQYGLLCYPSVIVPTTANVLTFANTLLPSAENNTTVTVYWVHTVTTLSPSNIVTWNLFRAGNEWQVGA